MQVLNYLITDGNCYWHTNVMLSSIGKVRIENVDVALNGSSSGHRAILGSTSTNFRFSSNTNNRWYLTMNGGDKTSGYGVDNKLVASVIEITKTSIDIDGTISTFGETTFDGNNGLWIFSAYNTPGDVQSNGGCIGKITVWDTSDTKIAEYTPVEDNGTVYFYDFVNETILQNDGSGTPTAGTPASSIIVQGFPDGEIGTESVTYTLTVSSETPWTATVPQGSFATLDVMSGSAGDTTVTMTVTTNRFSERSASLEFSNTEDTMTYTVTQKSWLKYWRPLQYIETDGTQRFTTDYTPNLDSEIEYKMRRCEWVAVSASGWDNYIGNWDNNSISNCSNTSSKCFFIRDYNKSSDRMALAFGNNERDGLTVTGWRTETNTDHVFTIDKTGVTLDSVSLVAWESTCFPNTHPLMFGSYFNSEFRSAPQRMYYLTSTENNNVAASFMPIIDENQSGCILNETTGVRSYPEWKNGYDSTTNPIKTGPGAYDFSPSRTSMVFEPAGGEYELTVTSESAWQCTSATGYTISPMSGSAGTTTVTVTAAPNAGTDKIKGTSTFYDAEGYAFDLKLTTKATGGHCEIYLGTTDLSEIKFGSYDVSKIMMGDVEVYGAGAFSGLKVRPTTVTLMNTDSEVITIKASEPWTITNIPDWLTVSKASGTAGTFKVTLTATQGMYIRSQNLSVTTANYSETLTVISKAGPFAMVTDGACMFDTGFSMNDKTNDRIWLYGVDTTFTDNLQAIVAVNNSFHIGSNEGGNGFWIKLDNRLEVGNAMTTYTGDINGWPYGYFYLSYGMFSVSSRVYTNETDHLYIFNSGANGTNFAPSGTSIQGLKLTDKNTGEEIFNFIPEYDLNGVPAFHDTVSDTFIYNSGTGTPTLQMVTA